MDLNVKIIEDVIRPGSCFHKDRKKIDVVNAAVESGYIEQVNISFARWVPGGKERAETELPGTVRVSEQKKVQHMDEMLDVIVVVHIANRADRSVLESVMRMGRLCEEIRVDDKTRFDLINEARTKYRRDNGIPFNQEIIPLFIEVA